MYSSTVYYETFNEGDTRITSFVMLMNLLASAWKIYTVQNVKKIYGFIPPLKKKKRNLPT